jgi:hypothetical protein
MRRLISLVRRRASVSTAQQIQPAVPDYSWHCHYPLAPLPERHAYLAPGDDPTQRDTHYLRQVIARSLWHMGDACYELTELIPRWHATAVKRSDAYQIEHCRRRAQHLHQELADDEEAMKRAQAELERRSRLIALEARARLHAPGMADDAVARSADARERHVSES